MSPRRRSAIDRLRGRDSILLLRGVASLPISRYLLVGGIGYLVCLSTFALAIHVLQMNEYAAIVPAFVTNTASNFFLNRIWTFDGADARAMRGDAVRYLVVALTCLVCNYALFYCFFTVVGLSEVVAQAVSVIVGLPVGFVGSRYWAFEVR